MTSELLVTDRRLTQLDGLRAVAVLLVVAAHVGFLLDLDSSTRRALAPLLSGDGVEIFFVLSGYLITGLLLRERERNGSMSLRRFYVRRALRIWPAFVAFLAVTAVLVAAGEVAVSAGDLVLSGLFVWNYVNRVAPFVGHTWSLAVEEQFYLLWPAGLQRMGARRALWVALGVVAVTPFLRWGTWDLLPSWRSHLSFMTHARADALLVGAALALAPFACPVAYGRLVVWVLRLHLDVVAAVYVFLLWPWLLADQSFYFSSVWSRSPLGVAAAVFLLGLLERPAGRMARLLSHRVAVHLGVLSYSVYLWQEPMLLHSYELAIPVRLLAILVLAEASLWFVEKPFLRLKRRFAPQLTVLP